MNVKDQRNSDAENVRTAIELLDGLLVKTADIQCDDLPSLAQKLTLLHDSVLGKNADSARFTDDEVFFQAVDIEANLYERLSVLDESRYTLSVMIEELHTLSSTLHANLMETHLKS